MQEARNEVKEIIRLEYVIRLEREAITRLRNNLRAKKRELVRLKNKKTEFERMMMMA